ncbi:hypothetical protein PENTCL1PPCAC_23978, partial [Pristionchus entomophagus]
STLSVRLMISTFFVVLLLLTWPISAQDDGAPAPDQASVAEESFSESLPPEEPQSDPVSERDEPQEPQSDPVPDATAPAEPDPVVPEVVPSLITDAPVSVPQPDTDLLAPAVEPSIPTPALEAAPPTVSVESSPILSVPSVPATLPTPSLPSFAPSFPSIGSGAVPMNRPHWTSSDHDHSHEDHHHHDHHRHSSEEHHGHGWGGWGGHHHHHSEEEHHHHHHPHHDHHDHHDRDSSEEFEFGRDRNGGCGLFMQLLGACGDGSGPSGNPNNPAQPSNNWGSNSAGNTGQNTGSGGSWWQQRLGDAGSQKIPNPIPSLGTGSGTGSFGSGSLGTGSLGSGSFGAGFDPVTNINLPRGQGSFDEPSTSIGTGGGPNLPRGMGSFDEPGTKSGFGSGGSGGLRESNSFDWMKQPAPSGVGSGGLKDTSSFGSGTGGMKDTSTFGSGRPKQPSSFDDWTKTPSSFPSVPTPQAETTVTCKSMEFIGFSNGRMQFKCDCGAGGISYQEGQCVGRAPALRAPIIHSHRGPSSTFGWI